MESACKNDAMNKQLSALANWTPEQIAEIDKAANSDVGSFYIKLRNRETSTENVAHFVDESLVFEILVFDGR